MIITSIIILGTVVQWLTLLPITPIIYVLLCGNFIFFSLYLCGSPLGKLDSPYDTKM